MVDKLKFSAVIKKIIASKIFFLIFILCVSCSINAQNEDGQILLSESIRTNQLGYYPNASKIAVVVGKIDDSQFYITSLNLQDTLFSASLSEERKSGYSPTTTRIADFSKFSDTGSYIVMVPGVGKSYPFDIKPEVHKALLKGSIKGFYFQRVSTDILDDYAGKWARSAGHPDTKVKVHASAATNERPEGTIISAPLGWYDAGDYNKYIVNSGITMGTLFSLYEDFPAYVSQVSVSIPEQENQLPDLLDEALWNLRWMLKMQDPHDGGVYHKLTAASFEGMIMPGEAKSQRYVVQKSTTATLDFAAVMAQAYRIFGAFEDELPGLADSCLIASKLAWEWGKQNPNKLYFQDRINEKFDPDISTGAYGDKNSDDELAWAAAELWISTGENHYLEDVALFPTDKMPLPSWGQVRSLGYYSLLRHKEKFGKSYPEQLIVLEKTIVSFADELSNSVESSAYATVMGARESDFIWGSNSVCANQGIALLQAYKISPDKKYLKHALANLDYLLGRNATGYSYVTGFGDKTPLAPHHRPSESDEIAEPVPGLLVGGPNPGQQDECEYASDIADESYTDLECSYASNEIAINWNAPLVYLAGAIEALQDSF